MTEQRTIPVSPQTRNRIRTLKGNHTYEEFISALAGRYESEAGDSL